MASDTTTAAPYKALAMRRVGAWMVWGMFAACGGPPGSIAEEPSVAPSTATAEVPTEASTNNDTPSPVGVATPLSCEQRVTTLENSFAGERPLLRVPTGVVLAKVAGWKEITELGPVISLWGSGEVFFEGEGLPRSEIMLRLENLGDDRESVPFFVMAHQKATARTVYALIKGIPNRLVPTLVVARDKVVSLRDSVVLPAGSAPWVAEWLDRHKSEESFSERVRQLQTGITKAAGTECKELSLAFKTIANAFGQTREVAAVEIPKALRACRCAGVDPGYEMIFTLSRARSDTLGQLPLGKALPSTVKADATVDELARALSASLPSL